MKYKVSMTDAYLSDRTRVEKLSLAPERMSYVLSVRSENEHNLKNIYVDLPIGLLTLVYEASSPGKSMLVNDIYRRRPPAIKRGK